MFLSSSKVQVAAACLMLLSNSVSGFMTGGISGKQASFRAAMESTTLLRDSEREGAAPLPLSTSDLQRLMAIKSSQLTIPLLIMDAVVPGQTISFASSDVKFHNLVNHVLQEGKEIGMVGLNPHTGQPLNVGVTLPVTTDDVMLDETTNMVTVHVQAKRRFEVQGEPWLHQAKKKKQKSTRDAAFYMAHVEIVNDRPEPALPDDVAAATQKLADQIPDMVGEWVHHLVATNRAEALRMESRMMELGPLPTEWRDQALWVAALLNPALGEKTKERVCMEIRPAMLSCHSDYERMILATAALKSSIDHVSGKKKLF